jgi:hypothetical protein
VTIKAAMVSKKLKSWNPENLAILEAPSEFQVFRKSDSHPNTLKNSKATF